MLNYPTDPEPEDELPDTRYMREALKLARRAYDEDEVPVGAIVVYKDKIIGKGWNQVERLRDATAHAEMIAMTAAMDYVGGKYLWDCTLYVTLEPCIMCAGGIRWAQVPRIVYGAADEKAGHTTLGVPIWLPKVQVTTGVLADESAELLRSFFQQKRKEKKGDSRL